MIESLKLQLLTPLDWLVLRKTRLEALLDSPHAFTSNHADESEWQEPEWQRAFDGATWIVAREAENVIGLARSLDNLGGAGTRYVDSVWVAPTHRRRGVCRTLLQALAETDHCTVATELWVLEDNLDAQHAYEALGFKPTGQRQLHPTVGRFELRLRLRADQLVGSRLPWQGGTSQLSVVSR